MRLIGRKKLHALIGVSAQTDLWLSIWASEVIHAHWKGPADVMRQFPHVVHSEPDLFCFDADGQPQAVELQIVFIKEIALITRVKKFVH